MRDDKLDPLESEMNSLIDQAMDEASRLGEEHGYKTCKLKNYPKVFFAGAVTALALLAIVQYALTTS